MDFSKLFSGLFASVTTRIDHVPEIDMPLVLMAATQSAGEVVTEAQWRAFESVQSTYTIARIAHKLFHP